jgi:hypothetical protein
MAQITRFLSAQLAKDLGLREAQGPIELHEGVILTLNAEPYLFPSELEGAVPAPLPLPGGFEPIQRIGTAAFNTPLSTNRSGVINLWGAGAVVGVDPPNKFSRYTAPPNRDYEIWGARLFLGMARGAIGEGNAVVQLTNGTTLTEDEIVAGAFDYHETNGNYDPTQWHMLPVPFIIPANRQLFFKWQINNLTASAQDFDLSAYIYWRYH